MPKSKTPRIVPRNAPGAEHGVIKLTQQELQLVHDFRLLSLEQRGFYFDAIQDCAMEARSKKPTLRLVTGGTV